MKILFLDSRTSVGRLIDIQLLTETHEVEFDGKCLYGVSDDYFRRYDSVVYTHYQDLISQKIILQCRKKHIITIFLYDGIFDWTNMISNSKHKYWGLHTGIPFICDYAFIPAFESQLSFLKRISPSTEFINYLPKRNFHDMLRHSQDLTSKKILITTANTAYFNNSEFVRLSELMSTFISSLVSEGIPYELRIFDSRLLSEIHRQCGTSSVKNRVNESLDELIGSYAAIATTPSSLILDFAHLESPIFTFIYRDSPQQLTGGWLLYPGGDNINTLKSAFTDSKDKDTRLFYQKSLLPCDDFNHIISTIEFREKYNQEFFDKIKTFTSLNYFCYFASKTRLVLEKYLGRVG